MSLGVGQILSDTFAMVRDRFWRLVGLYFVWFAILIGFSIVAMIVLGGGIAAAGMAFDDPSALGGLGAGVIGMMLLLYLGYVLISSAQNAAMCTMASPLRSGDFGDAMGTGVRAALTTFVVLVLLLIGYVVLFGVVGALAAALGTTGLIVGYAAAFVLLMWLGARIGIVMAVVPVDGVRNPLAAIGRAWRLTQGNALPIFLAFLAFIVAAGALVAALFVPVAMATGEGDPSPGMMIFLFFALVVVGTTLMVAYYALLSTIHAKLAGGTATAAAFE